MRISNLGLALLKLEEELSTARKSRQREGLAEVKDLVRTIATEKVHEREQEATSYAYANKVVMEEVEAITAQMTVSNDMSLGSLGFREKHMLDALVLWVDKSSA